jgi:hypothetical protein
MHYRLPRWLSYMVSIITIYNFIATVMARVTQRSIYKGVQYNS